MQLLYILLKYFEGFLYLLLLALKKWPHFKVDTFLSWIILMHTYTRLILVHIFSWVCLVCNQSRSCQRQINLTSLKTCQTVREMTLSKQQVTMQKIKKRKEIIEKEKKNCKTEITYDFSLILLYVSLKMHLIISSFIVKIFSMHDHSFQGSMT